MKPDKTNKKKPENYFNYFSTEIRRSVIVIHHPVFPVFNPDNIAALSGAVS
jgi:hypothetical protein